MSKRGYTVEEKSPGHITVTCDRSGLPYTGTNQNGFFCAAEPCQCQALAKTAMADLRKLMKAFRL